jgi:basic membrane lipoprotein Med (substrate-binding protein (PBP1-ABC) superfamily)
MAKITFRSKGMEKKKQETNYIDTYINIYNTFKELEAIKELIKDNIEQGKNDLIFKNSFSFTEDLLKLIKYTDTEFYNELKQQGAEQ